MPIAWGSKAAKECWEGAKNNVRRWSAKHPYPSGDALAPCRACDLTGFTDKVRRHIWSMEPKEKICPTCKGRGWVQKS